MVAVQDSSLTLCRRLLQQARPYWVVMITHRLSTLENCDAPLDIQHGRIIRLTGHIKPAPLACPHQAGRELYTAGVRTVGESG